MIILSSDQTTYKSSVGYGCPDNYWFSRNSPRRDLICEAEGLWLPLVDSGCIPIECPPLVTQSSNTTSLSLKTVVNVTCPDGFKFNTTRPPKAIVSLCDVGGRWNPDVPECIKTDKSAIVMPVQEAARADIIGYVSAALCGAALIAMLGIDFTSLRQSAVLFKNNLMQAARRIKS
jgi:hypothetical protein